MAKVVNSVLIVLGIYAAGVSCQSAHSPDSVNEPRREVPSESVAPKNNHEVRAESKQNVQMEEPQNTEKKAKECEGGRKIGETWSVDCNSCRCTENGMTACTLMQCEESKPNPSSATSGA